MFKSNGTLTRIDAKACLLGWWSKINECLLVSAFFICVLLPSVFLGYPGITGHKLKENRHLAGFPEVSIFFFEDLDKWYTDHFAGRSDLIYYGARWQMNWIGIPGNRNVLIGRDQWLFYDQYYRPGRPLFADFRGRAPFTPDQIARIKNNLLQTLHALASCNISFYLVMPPDKQTVYADMMPFHRDPQTITRADQLFSALRDVPELRFVDLRPTLQTARQNESLPLYLKTDTHWNALGAFHGIQAIMQALRADHLAPQLTPERNEYQIVSKPLSDGDIAASLLSLPDYFEDSRLSLEPLDNTPPKKTASQVPSLHKNPERLLLYGDSFSNLMQPFLAQRFNYVATVQRAQVNAQDIETEHPNIVILEVLERLIGSLETAPERLPDCGARP